ncbi:MAG: bifunctional diaminohydroxyphosphoribosylaminopyrimidine deaminase/5-amino-6-(5-phosphoribosylamino)uracil reductase RibD [Bacteroidetes bacterium]|nr:bifunctional diaminohydroxyphosphoribosylaminopyrimidine deaminase/5-amino-6-(5-phosphoribosylamino)uracil reductase RibD [Bacteroidota bacterium]
MTDEIYMQKAIKLSLTGMGLVNPNPLAGAVIVKNNELIGEGYHALFGEAHAEVNAINNAVTNCTDATIYITLEPCSHHGKTPPCALKIIDSKIKRVVIGITDPNPLVSGKGIKLLKDAGIEVTIGVLSNEIMRLNEVFIYYITKRTPFVVMKTASTFDGKIATSIGESRWISGEESQKFVHNLRQQYSGIMVGINTVVSDDPELTVRHFMGKKKHPVKIIIDSTARISLKAKALIRRNGSKTILAVTSKAPSAKIKDLINIGTEVIVCPKTEQGVDLKYLMNELGKMSIDSVLLEGGATLNYSALEQGIVNKAISIVAPTIVGGQNSPTAVAGKGIEQLSNAIKINHLSAKTIGDDILLEGYFNENN